MGDSFSEQIMEDDPFDFVGARRRRTEAHGEEYVSFTSSSSRYAAAAVEASAFLSLWLARCGSFVVSCISKGIANS
jgi:hypothetical protein